MRAAFALMLALLVAACGGGGGVPNPNPNLPQPQGPDMNGRFEATWRWSLGSTLLSESTDPLILLNTGIDRYSYIEEDGVSRGTLTATASGFSVTLTETSTEGTGTYQATVTISGSLTSNLLSGSGQAMLTLISGVDSEGLDGLSINVTLTAQRQGPTPVGTTPDLSGNYLAQFEWIDLPPGMDNTQNINLRFIQRSPGVYDVRDDDPADPLAMTLVAIGNTWYLLSYDEYFEDFTEYGEQWLLSGAIGANSLTGAGYIEWKSLDGTDRADLDGLKFNFAFQAARMN